MKKKSIKINYIYNVSYQILILLTPLITTPYISRVIGAHGIGTYSFIGSISSYFVLFAILGTTLYGQREISYFQTDIEKRSIVFWNILLLRFLGVIVSSLVYVIVILGRTDDKAIFLIMTMNIIMVVFDVSWLFQGMEEFGKIVGRNIFFKVLNIIFVFIFVKNKEDLFIYIAGTIVLTLLGHISLFPFISKFVNKVPFKSLAPFKNIKEIISLFIPTIAIQIYIVFDKTMIGLFSDGSLENGYYEQAMKIVKLLLVLVCSLGIVVTPRIGHYFSANNIKEIQKIIYRSFKFVWFLGVPICFGIIGVAGNMVPWFFGEGYDKVVLLIRILSFLILAIGISNVTGMQYLIPTKKQSILTKTVIMGACVNLILNLFLIPKLYSVGAAIASVLAEMVILVVQLVYVRKEFSVSEIVKSSVKYFISGSVMLMVLLFMERQMSPSIVNTVILIVAGMVCYLLCLLMLKDELLLSNVKTIVLRIRKMVCNHKIIK